MHFECMVETSKLLWIESAELNLHYFRLLVNDDGALRAAFFSVCFGLCVDLWVGLCLFLKRKYKRALVTFRFKENFPINIC